MSEHPAVTTFREYIRIKTVQPNPDYDSAVKFLEKQAQILGLPCKVVKLSSGFPVVIITWEGTDPSLPSIILNSHMDVVPVYPQYWKFDPFAAHKDTDGKIYGRGTQDMKCVGIWHLEAVRKLKTAGVKLLRTVHLMYVPDEEVLGHLGMKLFIETDEFKKLNGGYALDEGLACPDDTIVVYYGERVCLWFKLKVTGNPGHGSQFIQNTAAEKVRRLANFFLDYRAKEEKRLKNTPGLYIGDVNTTNINTWEGGVQMNVVPSEVVIGIDLRVSPKSSVEEVEALVQHWIKESGDGITLEYFQREEMAPTTPITDKDPFWAAFSAACKQSNLKIRPEIFPAATDSRYFRKIGIPALGFTPAPHTPFSSTITTSIWMKKCLSTVSRA